MAAARPEIAEVGAKGPEDRGRVIQKLIARVKGKAEGRDISDVGTGLLSVSMSYAAILEKPRKGTRGSAGCPSLQDGSGRPPECRGV